MELHNVARAIIILVLVVCEGSARRLPRSRRIHVRDTQDDARFIGLGGLTGGNNDFLGLGGNNGGGFTNFGGLGNVWQNLLSTFAGGVNQILPFDFPGKAQCQILMEKKLNFARLENGGVYVFFPGTLTWNRADRECKALGMHLVSMETKYENDLVIDYIWSQNFYNPDDSDCTWIGLVDGDGDTTTNDYYWITNNQQPTYDYWASDSDELCGCVYTNEDSLGDDVGWDSYTCENFSSYVCELEGDCAKFIDAVDVPYVSRRR